MTGKAGMTARSWHRGARAAVVAGIAMAALAGAGLVWGVPSASAATVDTAAWYVLVNRQSGKALDVYDRATADGARVTQWTRNNGAWQQWQFVDSGAGHYRLRSRHSGKVLERLDEWKGLEHPPDELLIIVTDWILGRMADPMVGARRATEFDDLWFAIIPGTNNGTDMVTCTYWIDATNKVARCSFYGNQSPPFGPP